MTTTAALDCQSKLLYLLQSLAHDHRLRCWHKLLVCKCIRDQKVGVGDRERYERVDPSHSWNSNNIATNVLLYHLQRHSDHHANPTRRYQSLRDFEESPVLPTGYAGMIVLALVPAVWRRVMDQRHRAAAGHQFAQDFRQCARQGCDLLVRTRWRSCP